MYHPCERWICVDFPTSDQKLTAVLKKVIDRRCTRSAAQLKEKLAAFFCPPLAPDVCLQLRVGRVLLLGRRSPAKDFLGNLLVKGNFLKFLTDEELPFSFASGDLPFKQAKGRRWEVVNFRDFESFMVKKHENDEECNLDFALTLTEGIVTTLMQAVGFSHVVYVHESGQSTKPGLEDELIDKMFWRIILALLSAAIRNERLVLVIAGNSSRHRPSPLSKKVKQAESARFEDCKNLLHLDIPYKHDDGDDDGGGGDNDDGDVAAEQAMATRDQHPDTVQHQKADIAQRILEQVLQKVVDTQSTFFNLEKLTQIRKRWLIREVVETFLTPVVKAMSKEPTRRMFRVGRSRTLSELSSVYKKIVNKERNDETVQVQRMWREQKNEEGQEVVWEEEEEMEEEEEEEAISSDNGRFCESRRLVIGENLDFCYLQMKCNIPVVKGIEVTVQSHDQGRWDYRHNHGTSETWGDLAVLAPDRETEIGNRIRVYTNRHTKVDKWQVHSKIVTDPLFLESIQAYYVIALYLCSYPGWCNYTCRASIKLLGP
ncbi:hypothetical protein L7F22_061483 [Adiantum nelumboides]|nr:hypothetical protein [Adiantum nelumboides]